MCLHKFGARDSWLNNWEHRGEDMYYPYPRALLKIPGSGTTFFFCVKDRPGAHPNTDKWLFQKWCQEVDVEEVLTTMRSWTSFHSLWASPPGK